MKRTNEEYIQKLRADLNNARNRVEKLEREAAEDRQQILADMKTIRILKRKETH